MPWTVMTRWPGPSGARPSAGATAASSAVLRDGSAILMTLFWRWGPDHLSQATDAAAWVNPPARAREDPRGHIQRAWQRPAITSTAASPSQANGDNPNRTDT